MKSIHDQVHEEFARLQTRKHFLRNCSMGLAGVWLGERSVAADSVGTQSDASDAGQSIPHFPPRAKRVIFLHPASWNCSITSRNCKSLMVRIVPPAS